jgi:redox-sensing transcriptional repressor
VLERLARYHQIATRAAEEGLSHLSSERLAKVVGVDATMVRKDMAAVSISGRPKVGYFIGDVLTGLGSALGLTGRHDAILIGCGDLGSALARYSGFARFGLRIVGVFDTDYTKVGRTVGEHLVLPMEKCKSVTQIFGVRIAILAVPARAAQNVTDWLVIQGVAAIWNFAPVDLHVPPDVAVRNENLALGLAQFLHQVQHGAESSGRTTPPS